MSVCISFPNLWECAEHMGSWTHGVPAHMHVVELEHACVVCQLAARVGTSKVVHVDSELRYRNWPEAITYIYLTFVYLHVASENNMEEVIVLSSCAAFCSLSLSMLYRQKKKPLTVTYMFKQNTTNIFWALGSEGVGKGTVLGSGHVGSISIFCKLYSTSSSLTRKGRAWEFLLRSQQHLSTGKSS